MTKLNGTNKLTSGPRLCSSTEQATRLAYYRPALHSMHRSTSMETGATCSMKLETREKVKYTARQSTQRESWGKKCKHGTGSALTSKRLWINGSSSPTSKGSCLNTSILILCSLMTTFLASRKITAILKVMKERGVRQVLGSHGFSIANTEVAKQGFLNPCAGGYSQRRGLLSLDISLPYCVCLDSNSAHLLCLWALANQRHFGLTPNSNMP